MSRSSSGSSASTSSPSSGWYVIWPVPGAGGPPVAFSRAAFSASFSRYGIVASRACCCSMRTDASASGVGSSLCQARQAGRPRRRCDQSRVGTNLKSLLGRQRAEDRRVGDAKSVVLERREDSSGLPPMHHVAKAGCKNVRNFDRTHGDIRSSNMRNCQNCSLFMQVRVKGEDDSVEIFEKTLQELSDSAGLMLEEQLGERVDDKICTLRGQKSAVQLIQVRQLHRICASSCCDQPASRIGESVDPCD
eukprot:m.582395 g.582395  ORF g.582395 m.582395 type:complete len:248 (-) comp57943_c0_seq3:205-948(-)